MEALGFPSLNTHSISCSSSQKRKATKPPSQRTHFSSISSPSSLKLTPSYRSYHFRRSATRMQVDSEGYELKQMRDMAAAKKRWETLFAAKVSDKFPEDTDHIIACQKGLSFHGRSLAACQQLYNTGYQNLFWVQGGVEAAEEEDLVREGPLPFKFAGIGGLSEFLGWTDQQRAAAAKENWSYRLVFSARLVRVILLADALFLGARQFGHYLQVIRSL